MCIPILLGFLPVYDPAPSHGSTQASARRNVSTLPARRVLRWRPLRRWDNVGCCVPLAVLARAAEGGPMTLRRGGAPRGIPKANTF